jgi:uncharacterized protein (TIGR02145 family)
MKKLKITVLLFCLILVINSCGPDKDKPETQPPVDEAIVSKLEEVTIGNQVWTSKNLDVSTYRNGDDIPLVEDTEKWINLTTGAWCYYENKTGKGSTYGKLYNWYAVNDPRGLAPKGYHIPSDAEWSILTTYLGTDAAAKMKSTTGWDDDGNGNNTSGFAGLPGGGRSYNGVFFGIGAYGYWWSSSEGGADFAWFRNLSSNNGFVYRNSGYGRFGFSVRCLRD